VFIQLDHALMLHWMHSPMEGSHSSAVVLDTERAAPSLRGAFALIDRCDGYVPVATWLMLFISPPTRMMAFAYPASPERFVNSNRLRYVRRRF
jgi:hypothetical protein